MPPVPPTRFPTGTGGVVPSQKMEAAAVRGIDAWSTVIRKCERIIEEIDEVTPVEGTAIPVELHEEDSAVVAVATAIEAQKVAGGATSS